MDPTATPARTPAPAERWQPIPSLQQPSDPDSDSGEWVPELVNAWYEEYLARRTLQELQESGALSAIYC